MAPRKEVSLSLLSFIILVVLALGLAYSYRVPGLELRPMHTDEAILGIKLGEFWKTGHFQYDPTDFHGPALHQVSLLWGKMAGWADPVTWTEADLRFVAVLCGFGVLLSTLLFADVLGRYATIIAMLLTATSPMMVYYSRYFIMEMLLVLLVSLMLGCFWRYSQSGSKMWLLLGGCTIGFQHAAKETFVLNIGAAFLAWVIARTLVGDFQPAKTTSFSPSSYRPKKQSSRLWLWIAIPALLVSVAAYSNGFRDWAAVQDSFMTYISYLQRSGGSGHEKPWHYYITLLVWRKDTLVWSEALIVGLALIGMIYSLLGDFQKNQARQAFLVFLSAYSVILLAGYSILSYKTPWSILCVQHALILLAGVGASALWAHVMPGKSMRFAFNVMLAVGLWHFCLQSSRLTGTHPKAQFEYSADPRNPYAYSHTQKSLQKLMAQVKTYAADKGDDLQIQVISPESGWPLPWYWRGWKNAGYQAVVPDNLNADIIVAGTDFYDEVKSRLPEGAYSEHYPFGLRPGIMLTLFLKKQVTPEPTPATEVPTSPQDGAPQPGSAEPAPPPPAGTILAPPAFGPTSTNPLSPFSQP